MTDDFMEWSHFEASEFSGIDSEPPGILDFRQKSSTQAGDSGRFAEPGPLHSVAAFYSGSTGSTSGLAKSDDPVEEIW